MGVGMTSMPMVTLALELHIMWANYCADARAQKKYEGKGREEVMREK